MKKDKDDGSADVDLNFGSYHLGVKAASYQTPDSPDKVEAFYRGALKRYGDVIACRNSNAVGKPVRTFEGLTCDSHEGNHVQVNDHPDKHSLELKTGSEQRQRIVEIEPNGGGTKFSLVALDLPGIHPPAKRTTTRGSRKPLADACPRVSRRVAS